MVNRPGMAAYVEDIVDMLLRNLLSLQEVIISVNLYSTSYRRELSRDIKVPFKQPEYDSQVIHIAFYA